MSKAIAQKLGNFIESSIQYDTKAIVDEVRDYIRIRVKLDARVLLRCKKKIMLNTNKHIHAQFPYERLSILFPLWSFRAWRRFLSDQGN